MNYTFLFYYKKNGIGYVPTVAPTIKIIDFQGNSILNNQALISLGGGVYAYTLSTLVSNEYIGVSHTNDLTVDEQDLIYWLPNNLSQNIDEPISKSKNISSSSIADITNSVWNNSSRTMTSYGSLVDSIWNNSSRTLSSYGNLVDSIWNYNNRTMTSFGSLVDSIWGNSVRTLSVDNVTGEKIKESFNTMILFIGKTLDEYYNAKGNFPEGQVGFYEKMAKDAIEEIG